jgi:hypothetical protein
MRGDRATALDRLRQAVDRGLYHVDPAQDPDFASLHDDPELEALAERVRQNAAAQRAE